jgi:hypothetical protein
MPCARLAAALAAAALGALAPAAHANLLANGSFEDIGQASMQGWGGFTFGAGYSPVLPGWAIDAGTVDVTTSGSFWGPASAGVHSLDINGWNAGTISQTLATVAGQAYRVSFDYSRNVAGAPDPAQALVNAGSGSFFVSAANDGSYGSGHAMQWKGASFDFVAGGASTLFSVAAVTGTNGGVYFDNFSVTAVPEPGTWAMLAAGLAAVGFIAARRRAG